MARTKRVEFYSRLAEKENAGAMSHLRFPDKPFPHTMLMVFKKYDFQQYKSGFGLNESAFDASERGSGIGLRSSDSIELPFPKQLVDTNTMRLNGYERSPITENLTLQLTKDMGTGEATINQLPQLIQAQGASIAGLAQSTSGGDVMDSIKGFKVQDVASAATYLARKLIPGDIGRSINAATGQVVNPRETLAFEGVNLRNHQFNWDLYPTNQRDSERIREIVEKIKQNSLPSVQDLPGIRRAFLKYPSVVDIYLLGVNQEYYMKFKTSMVTNFTVDYGAGGNLAIIKGGKPAGVNIALQLSELEIESAQDYGVTAPDKAKTFATGYDGEGDTD